MRLGLIAACIALAAIGIMGWQAIGVDTITRVSVAAPEDDGRGSSVGGGRNGNPDAQADGVVVMSAATIYRPGEPIVITVTNDGAGPIYTEDMKSGCTVIILEQWAEQDWRPLLGCGSERTATVVRLDPGESRQVTLDPFSSHFTNGLPVVGPAFEPGWYRACLRYRLAPGPEAVEPFRATSDLFTVMP